MNVVFQSLYQYLTVFDITDNQLWMQDKLPLL